MHIHLYNNEIHPIPENGQQYAPVQMPKLEATSLSRSSASYAVLTSEELERKYRYFEFGRMYNPKHGPRKNLADTIQLLQKQTWENLPIASRPPLQKVQVSEKDLVAMMAAQDKARTAEAKKALGFFGGLGAIGVGGSLGIGVGCRKPGSC